MTSQLLFSRRALLICLALCAASRPAHAQTRIYVGGDLFTEITQMSRTTVTPDQIGLTNSAALDGVTAGGGARVGAFFSPEWTLELGVDLGRTFSHSELLSVRIPAVNGFPFPAPQFESRTSSRFSATSVLVGYHPRAGRRIQPGFRGGVSLMHTQRTSTNASVSLVYSTSIAFPVPVPSLSVDMTEVTAIGNGLTATLGAEAAIEVSRHFAVVPELRVHAGGLGGVLLRPGVAARWLW